MPERIRSRLENLSDLNVALRRRWELAEAFLPAANTLLAQLAHFESDLRVTLTGSVLRERPYDTEAAAPGGGQVAQAALQFPGGLGVLLWDSEEYLDASQSPDLLAGGRPTFVPLEQCSRALQALLLDQALPLIDQLMQTLAPCENKSCRS